MRRPGADLFNDLLDVVRRFGLAFDPHHRGERRAPVTRVRAG
jgi:hypothetical protein